MIGKIDEATKETKKNWTKFLLENKYEVNQAKGQE